MPTATMTSAPKKRDFFNGSQGLNFRDFRSPEPQETQDEDGLSESAEALDHERGHSSSFYPPDSTISEYHSSQDFRGISSADYSFPVAPFPSRHSPADYYSHVPQEGCSLIAPPGFGVPSRGPEFDDAAPLVEAPGSYHASGSPVEPQPWTGSSQPPSPGDDGDNDDGKKKTKKRKQRCRMCANHGIYVEIKGHKWYCPYKNLQHNCTKCEITRKRQYFMAEQQKLTREQQQQQLPQQGAVEGSQGALPPAAPTDFPRMRELLEETDHILDEELFRQIEECVRPKGSQHH